MGTKAIAETIQDAKAKKERVTFARVDRVLDMPDLLKFGLKFNPVTNTLANKAGSQTLARNVMDVELDDTAYEVVFA